MAFNRDRNQGGNRDFGSRGGFNDRRSERPQMHPATCSNCGKPCEVPFKPNGSKPVLCNDCFRQSGGPERRFDDRGRGNDRGPRFDKPRFEPRRDNRPTPPPAPHKEEFNAINHKLDKILGILMAATEAEVPAKTKKEIIEVMAEEAPVVKKAKAPKKKAEKKEEVAPVEETVITEEVTPEPTA